MSYKHTIYKGTPNLEAYAEKGRLEERDYQDALALKKNEQALSLRQIMNQERATKQAQELEMRRLAAQEKAAELKERMDRLDMVAKQQQISSFETPQQQREAESAIRLKESTMAAEAGLEERQKIADMTLQQKKDYANWYRTTPEGRLELAKTISDIDKNTNKGSLSMEDIVKIDKDLTWMKERASLAREAGDDDLADAIDAKVYKNETLLRQKLSEGGKGNQKLLDILGVATTLSQPAAEATEQSLNATVSTLDEGETRQLESISTREQAEEIYNSTKSAKLRTAVAQKVAIFDKYIEDASRELIDAIANRDLVFENIKVYGGPERREAAKRVKDAQKRLDQVRDMKTILSRKLTARELTKQ